MQHRHHNIVIQQLLKFTKRADVSAKDIKRDIRIIFKILPKYAYGPHNALTALFGPSSEWFYDGNITLLLFVLISVFVRI